MDRPYQHTQVGYTIWLTCGLAAAFIWGLLFNLGSPGWAGVSFLLLALCAWLFGSLTIQVNSGSLRWHFGPGILPRSVPLSEVVNAEPVRNRWIYGWGIRWTPHGWLYNVSGLEAVELTLKTGGKFRLGTDEPDRLCHAIRSRLNKNPTFPGGV
jgi:hypothetical protein